MFTPVRILFLGLLAWLLTTAVKLAYLSYLVDSPWPGQLIAAAVFAVSVAVCVRRFEYITYIEAVIVGFLWVAFSLFLDFIFVSLVVGKLSIFIWQVWLSYLVLWVCVLFLHKKKHILRRQELAAKHHH